MLIPGCRRLANPGKPKIKSKKAAVVIRPSECSKADGIQYFVQLLP